MKENKFYISFFNILNKKGIKYSVLRNYKSLPLNTGGSDLDLWVAHEDGTKTIEILKTVTIETNSKLVSVLEDNKCPKYCFLNTEYGAQIDLFLGDIPYQHNTMIEAKVVENSRRLYNNIWVMDDTLSDLIALLKEIINNGRVQEKYIIPIEKNKNTYTEDYLKSKLTLFSPLFISLLSSSIKNSSIQINTKQIHRLGRSSLGKKYTINSLKKLWRIAHPPGYVIAVLGTDGSGKSTIIDAITPIVEEAFHKGIIYNHLRPNWLPELGVLLGKKKKTDKTIIVSNPHAEKASGIVGSLMRWFYYLQDYIWGYLRIIWPVIHTKAKVFIFDRYYYDNYIDQRRARTSLPRWVFKIGELFVPRPDLILCLGGDPAKIYERKPETSLEEVTRQTNVLKTFCSSKKNAVWIDTTIAPEKSIDTAMKAIVEVMSKRFKFINK